ncbi:winged helix-turn-helix transcriptional regulator [Streptomyces sp. NRRL S-920]|uniref:winged helix-turn-helix transcriptional regulator n=1 Tax=Streptomyces sp. NRRL S-920 TaxID=1463921 RepID=UPI0009979E79|nr:helix-turn-helix domain-containing protein [Streptomyces sp. NRRL S-920]
MEITLAALRGRWTTLVVRELLRHERHTYSELASALPELSDKVLTDRLAQLVTAGAAERTRIPGWPPAVTYELTPHGRALGPALQALWDWGRPARPRSEPRGHEGQEYAVEVGRRRDHVAQLVRGRSWPRRGPRRGWSARW